MRHNRVLGGHPVPRVVILVVKCTRDRGARTPNSLPFKAFRTMRGNFVISSDLMLVLAEWRSFLPQGTGVTNPCRDPPRFQKGSAASFALPQNPWAKPKCRAALMADSTFAGKMIPRHAARVFSNPPHTLVGVFWQWEESVRNFRWTDDGSRPGRT
jgi:hypothetical protein